jgi:hypothetical protein
MSILMITSSVAGDMSILNISTVDSPWQISSPATQSALHDCGTLVATSKVWPNDGKIREKISIPKPLPLIEPRGDRRVV